jgi:hypothetical protein
MIDTVSSQTATASEFSKLILPLAAELDPVPMRSSDSLEKLFEQWEQPTADEWRRAAWMVALGLLRGIVGSNTVILAHVEPLSAKLRASLH